MMGGWVGAGGGGIERTMYKDIKIEGAKRKDKMEMTKRQKEKCLGKGLLSLSSLSHAACSHA